MTLAKAGSPLLLDHFESTDLERLLRQSLEVTRTALNSMGFADVLIFGHDNHRIQIENKQVSELLSDLDGCERQLRSQYNAAEESLLLIRGVAVPDVDGIQTYTESSGKGRVFYKSKRHRTSYARYRSWLHSLDKVGVTCIEVPTLICAAATIVAIYKYAQKPSEDHSTLRRYIKPKIRLEERDLYVETLMGVSGANLGEVRAKELVRVFGTPYAAFLRSTEEIAEVPGMGRELARRMFKGIGRPE